MNTKTGLQESKNAASGSVNVDLGLTYGFYAIMGCFVVDVSNIHDSHKQFTLTTEGFHFLAERGHFPKTSKRLIHGKTKPGFLAKGLICIQVGCLVMQRVTSI